MAGIVAPPRTMEDSAWPFPAGHEPPADCVLIYGPGDTPHTWTPGDIHDQTARFRFPGFVRSDPFSASYVQDCNAMVAWLKSIGAPKGTAVFWDLEIAVAAGYLSAVGHIMNLEGYKVLPYGSIGYIWQNPALDGLFVSHPDGTPHLCTPARCGNGLNADALITQYEFTSSVDWSLIAATVPLWDTYVAPPPPEEPVTPQDIQAVAAAVVNALHTDFGVFNKPGWMGERVTQCAMAAIEAELQPGSTVYNRLLAAIKAEIA